VGGGTAIFMFVAHSAHPQETTPQLPSTLLKRVTVSAPMRTASVEAWQIRMRHAVIVRSYRSAPISADRPPVRTWSFAAERCVKAPNSRPSVAHMISCAPSEAMRNFHSTPPEIPPAPR
jgi:hypothetical protein